MKDFSISRLSYSLLTGGIFGLIIGATMGGASNFATYSVIIIGCFLLQIIYVLFLEKYEKIEK